MRITKQFNVSIPNTKVNDALEEWLRADVVASYDAMRSEPSRGISSEDMRAHLAQLHDGHGHSHHGQQ
ncbi:hypothetical protein ACT3TB_06705 [Micrococcaceae sp. AOP34-BR2-30]